MIQSRYSFVSDCKVHFADAGLGSVPGTGHGSVVLILCHPLQLIGSYQALIETLSRRHRVIALELPGSGQSDRLRKLWRSDDYAQFVDRFARVHRLKQLTVFGHGPSAVTALNFLYHYPNLVRKVVINREAGTKRLNESDLSWNLVRHPFSASVFLLNRWYSQIEKELEKLTAAGRSRVVDCSATRMNDWPYHIVSQAELVN